MHIKRWWADPVETKMSVILDIVQNYGRPIEELSIGELAWSLEGIENVSTIQVYIT